MSPRNLIVPLALMFAGAAALAASGGSLRSGGEAPVCPPGTAPAAFYASDFEADDGGWVESGAGEWERGVVVPGVFQGCDSSPRPEPTGAHSGVNVWATNLDGCYANAGAESLLTRTFDFSALPPPISLDWWNWYEIFVTFDKAEVWVNGILSWQVVTTAATPDYIAETLDLSSYAGQASVEIEFRLWATTVVNRMGWYLDDVQVLYCTDVVFVDGFESGDLTAWSAALP